MATVLLVDHHRARGHRIQELLEAHGYRVYLATSVGEARRYVRQHQASVVFVANGAVGTATSPATLGRVVALDPEAVDRVRLELLLQFAAREARPNALEHRITTPSAN